MKIGIQKLIAEGNTEKAIQELLISSRRLNNEELYQEALLLEDNYNSYEQDICPRCGSKHQTTFNNIVSNLTDEEPLSGDLKFRTLVMGKCLSCGLERPVRFRCIREA